MRHYEIVFLVHPDQSEQVPGMVDRYKAMITENKGRVDRFEDWGRRQLSYSINKVRKAHYILMNITCDLKTLEEVESSFRYNDAIIRDLILSKKSIITEPSPMMNQPQTEDEKKANADKEKSSSAETANTTKQRKYVKRDKEDVQLVDYKDVDRLRQYIMKTGRILPRRITKTSARYQRKLASEIRLARHLALLEFCDQHK